MAQTGSEKAKDEIFASIRKSLAASAPFDAIRQEHHGHHEQLDSAPLTSKQIARSLMDVFCENLRFVGGQCQVVADINEAIRLIEKTVTEKDAKRIAVSDSPMAIAIGNNLKTGAEISGNASSAELFDCDIGITGVQWGIAETGTLVLESNDERNRLASLVPPIHIAVFKAAQIREKMSEILALISTKDTDEISRAVTFITGPSRTSDIELTLAIGVHGPKELHVIIIDER